MYHYIRKTGLYWIYTDPIESLNTVQGGRVKISQSLKQALSAYCNATKSRNMSYKRNFCGLSENVQFQKVRSKTKYTHRSKWNTAETSNDKFIGFAT